MLIGIVAPGMAGSRDGTLLLVLEHTVDVFSRDDVRLFSLFVKGSERQRFSLVSDGDIFVGIQGNGDRRFAHGQGRAVDLDLIDNVLKLEGQVVGEDAGFSPGKDMGEILGSGKRPMGIKRALRLDCEAGIEVDHEIRQEGIARLPI